jgi:asparagine synthetase B (glutamine-hydrolysing)
LQAKGDRVSMHSSVEVRYPFLDEEVFDFTAKLHPRWKLRGFRDKYLLRLLAERWIPKSIARRHKVIFRAPLDSFHMDPEPPYVTQLLSEDSLRRTGYFDLKEVAHWRRNFRGMRAGFRDFRWKWVSPGRRHATLAPSMRGGRAGWLPKFGSEDRWPSKLFKSSARSFRFRSSFSFWHRESLLDELARQPLPTAQPAELDVMD